jgi:pimeloyl-ACP methyl ester carboxylesterase
METQTGFADVNGTRLYYEMAGSGHPLVLVHGFTLDTRMWDDQFEMFAGRNQVVRYDLRGFGKSALPTTEPYSHPDDLRALMTHLGIEHAFIIGLSLGGAVAVDFAVTYPDATDAFIPVDAALIGGYEWVEGRPSAGMHEQARRAGLETAKTFWLNHPLFAATREKPVAADRLAQMVETYSGWHVLNDDPIRVPEPPAIERLGTLNAPTLVVVGERDLVDFHRIADIMAERIAGAKKVVMPGVGHMSNMEDPDRFNEIVLGFLAEVS